MYLFTNCSVAGVWEVELEVAAIRIGAQLDEKKVAVAFKNKIIELNQGQSWFIPSFITIQYGKELKTSNPALRKTIEELLKYDLIELNKEENYKLKTKPLTSPSKAPSIGTKVKEEIKGKVELKEGEEVKEEDAQEVEILEPYPFELFWETYDNKKGKKPCIKKWATLSDEIRAKIIQQIPLYLGTITDVKYQKHPITYLNQDAWEDEIKTKRQKPDWDTLIDSIDDNGTNTDTKRIDAGS